MSPAARIARLDRQLAKKGENVVLKRRKADGNWADLTCLAKKTGFLASELIGDLAQQESVLIISPTPIAAQNWPGAGNGDPVPQKGDIALIGGSDVIVEAGTAIRSGDTVIRIEVRVKGAAN